MIHSPACEAFRDRRICRDHETAESQAGSSCEQEHRVPTSRARIFHRESPPPRVLSADADAGRRVHSVVLVSRCCFVGLFMTRCGYPIALQ